ncbi:hypothetical protein MKK69_02225 [Methylobacterium sp. J-026]|uniref:hypothetical protein n=1 Tax=Methylobacterium sp. J-026 TaxID=2836624 RepID=UPI001FBBCE6C|nr:hypothetical protein [Methylobacterium sp. J-026]MCJ2132893.1 hypothetical protein [Methylobacterium sp. J-026]
MAEVSNDPIYEVLKAMQMRLGTLDEGLRDVRGELKGMRISLQAQQVQMNAVQADVGNLYEAFGARDPRLARIERRLDITDAPVS